MVFGPSTLVHCVWIWQYLENGKSIFILANGTYSKCCCMATERGNKFFWEVPQADHEDVQTKLIWSRRRTRGNQRIREAWSKFSVYIQVVMLWAFFSAPLCLLFGTVMSFFTAESSEKPPVSWVKSGWVCLHCSSVCPSLQFRADFTVFLLSATKKRADSFLPTNSHTEPHSNPGKIQTFWHPNNHTGLDSHTQRAGWGMVCKCVRCPARSMFAFCGWMYAVIVPSMRPDPARWWRR